MRAVILPVLAALVLVTSVGWARTTCVPSAILTTSARGIALVGQTGMADAAGAVTYVVRDPAGNVVPGSVVALDFSRCTDVRLASDVVAAGTTVDCARGWVHGVADLTGTVTFKIVGSGAGGAPRTVPTCASAYADGVPLPPLIVSAFDLDGMSG